VRFVGAEKTLLLVRFVMETVGKKRREEGSGLADWRHRCCFLELMLVRSVEFVVQSERQRQRCPSSAACCLGTKRRHSIVKKLRPVP